jgi:dipeptidyl aminopeptidase/acylaminoacyl peptidase
MERDIRETDFFKRAESLFSALRRPGTGTICDASQVSSNGTHAAFAGTMFDSANGVGSSRICVVGLSSGDARVVSFGPNMDRSPKFSPDGTKIAFLSDRRQLGHFELYFLDPIGGTANFTAPLDGWIEYLHWSPDGSKVLLGVAGHGADITGGQGAVATKQLDEALPSWVPRVELGDETYRWRRAWVYDLTSGRMQQVSKPSVNVWESCWCGNRAIAAVISPGPGEGLWYSARLSLIDLESGIDRQLYVGNDQLGWPGASPSGTVLAIVEGLCSDRGYVAGELHLIATGSGELEKIPTRGVEVTYTEWRSDDRLLLAGHRGFETVVGIYDVKRREFSETWASSDQTSGGLYASVAGLNKSGDCVILGESFLTAPEIAVIRDGNYKVVWRLDVPPLNEICAIEPADRITWNSVDGLEIQGWLVRPKRELPHPVVTSIHGGPIWHYRPMWLGRNLGPVMLIDHGYAVFFPNPRGSSGRGQHFTRQVLGDMGGADTQDYLSGLDYLISRGLADPTRLGVTGGSYGGFMTSWLITQDNRFAAAVPLAPVANQVTEHLIGNIPDFVRLFLADHYTNPGGKYFQRSPIMHAHKSRTPTLNVCGALDRCTPPEEAIQFHNALLEHGVVSVLVTYPEEGHGIRNCPAALDYAARLTAWFDKYMPASPT